MTTTIMVGIDMHVKTLVSEIGYGKVDPFRITYKNDFLGRLELLDKIEEIKKEQNSSEVLVAHEASGLGYVLHDKLTERGYRCAVLAPTELKRSATGFKKKTDKKDASYIYETVRGHVLAGNQLHDIWIPNKQLRDDREVVRTWFDISKKITCVKIQVQALLKKADIQRPEKIESWSKSFMKWLSIQKEKQHRGFQISLESLLRQLLFLESEEKLIRKEVQEIAKSERHKDVCEELLKIKGVGLKTAMTFLVEIGDCTRFSNRRQLGAYIGLVPSTNESGDCNDRKGRITRSGPYRVRSILNQALWVHLRYNGELQAYYDRIAEKNPKRKKKAVVACMRLLAIKMWHTVLNVVHARNKEFAA